MTRRASPFSSNRYLPRTASQRRARSLCRIARYSRLKARRSVSAAAIVSRSTCASSGWTRDRRVSRVRGVVKSTPRMAYIVGFQITRSVARSRSHMPISAPATASRRRSSVAASASLAFNARCTACTFFISLNTTTTPRAPRASCTMGAAQSSTGMRCPFRSIRRIEFSEVATRPSRNTRVTGSSTGVPSSPTIPKASE